MLKAAITKPPSSSGFSFFGLSYDNAWQYSDQYLNIVIFVNICLLTYEKLDLICGPGFY